MHAAITLPEGMTEPLVDEIDEPEEHAKVDKNKAEKWTDLGW